MLAPKVGGNSCDCTKKYCYTPNFTAIRKLERQDITFELFGPRVALATVPLDQFKNK